MPTSQKSFNFESFQDADSIQDFLESLMEGMAAGRITLSSGDETIELAPAELLHFQVKAGKKRDESRISLRISWKDSGAAGAVAISITPR